VQFGPTSGIICYLMVRGRGLKEIRVNKYIMKGIVQKNHLVALTCQENFMNKGHWLMAIPAALTLLVP